MIPKIIHYCWFGKGEKPKKIQKCINTWKEKCSDYQIIEWNEDNFDINQFQYTKEAYEAKKYAFVSDVARVKALYDIGGIYLDTDVIVHKNFDGILNHKCVLGFELENYIATSFMACEKGFNLMNDFYNLYQNISFFDENDQIITMTNVIKLTDMLTQRGLVRNNQFQTIGEIIVYPQEYFSPYDYSNCVRKNTDKTICEHMFLISWANKTAHLKKTIKKVAVFFIGNQGMDKIRTWFKKKT